MVLRQPSLVRRGNPPFGSAVLSFSARVAAGSTFTSDPVDVSRFREKSFSFRGNAHGSHFVDVVPGTVTGGPWLTLQQGTFPKSTGSIRVESFTEAFGLARARLIATSTGSFSVYFTGLGPTSVPPS